jgi:hypothetical protein
MKKSHSAVILVFASGIVGSSLGSPPGAVTNSWIKPTAGNWSEAAAWSAGHSPASTYSVEIANDGVKTVEVNAATAASSPSPLTVFHLLVGTNNTLWFNNVGETFNVDAGTNRYLGFHVYRGGTVRNSQSDLLVTNLRVEYSEFIHDGGNVDVVNGLLVVGAPGYVLKNGNLNTYSIAMPSAGIFRQEGGSLNVTKGMQLDWLSKFTLVAGEQTYHDNGLSIKNECAFTQSGGVVRTPSVGAGGGDGDGAYLMDGGALYTDRIGVVAWRERGFFEHNAGLVVVTNGIELIGSARYYPPRAIEAVLTIDSNAVLRANWLKLNQDWGFCSFQSAGEAAFAGNIEVVGDPLNIGDIRIVGGTLSCANFLNDTGAVDIVHTGGALNVANTLSFTGYYPGVYGGIHARPGRYDFQGGTISAPNIDLAAELVIGSSLQANRISNSGEFNMAGALRVGDATEQLGRFTLADDAAIILDSGNARISFVNSSGGSWNNSATLSVVSWGGSLIGGGADRVRFGTSRGGLTAQQLQQIRFVNPVGLPAGQYMAQILDNGEITPIPNAPQMSLTANPNALVVTWSGSGVLQGSQKVEGPYEDIPTSTSTYAADVNAFPQLFLRVRP